MNLFNEAFKGKKVLLTGHTGFKGSWLSIWLVELGAEVIGVGKDPNYENHPFDIFSVSKDIIDIRKDILDLEGLLGIFEKHKPDFVIHFAAQPIVRESYLIPVETFQANLNGSLHLLEAIRQNPTVKGGLFVTTDKVYHNNNWNWGYREPDARGGYDPYSASKACADIAVDSYRSSYFKNSGQKVATVRTGNTVGGGDWAKKRIIPDCIRACAANQPIVLRKPHAKRPWQYVLEPLSFYLSLSEKLLSGKEGFDENWNAGPTLNALVTVEEIASLVIRFWGSGSIVMEHQHDILFESDFINVDVSEAFLKLKWLTTLNIEDTIKMSVEWYKEYLVHKNNNMRSFGIKQIKQFVAQAREKKLHWAL